MPIQTANKIPNNKPKIFLCDNEKDVYKVIELSFASDINITSTTEKINNCCMLNQDL